MSTIEIVKAKAAHRRQMVANMRSAGMTYQEIADELGISRQRVHAILNGRADQRGEK